MSLKTNIIQFLFESLNSILNIQDHVGMAAILDVLLEGQSTLKSMHEMQIDLE